jgi:hypothetical protein
MYQKLFFQTSKQIADRLTETFDFIWPTAAAIWNLRWQVQGYVSVVPGASQDELLGRFVAGSGIRGANLRKTCVETSWQRQQDQFAKFLLVEICALYEAWCSSVVSELGIAKSHENSMQFPSGLKPGGALNGVGLTLAEIRKSVSPDLKATLYPSLKANKKYDLVNLDNLLVCYRFFKECRNAVIHHGGVASQRTVDAYTVFSQLKSSDLSAKEVPKHYPVKPDAAVLVDLRGIVGFGDIVLKLIATLDAELSTHQKAEVVLAGRWKSVHGVGHFLPTDASAKQERISKSITKLGLPKPKRPEALAPFVRRYRLMQFA